MRKNRLILIIGGAGSGKSEFAENLSVKLYNEYDSPNRHLWYLATMKSQDEESVRKIQKHIERRKDTPFTTAEMPVNVASLPASRGDVVLLECMSNLLANEMFSDYNESDLCRTIDCVDKITKDIASLCEKCDCVVVSNEVSLDGCDYDETTCSYISNLSHINTGLAKIADEVIEVVAGIPVYAKRTQTGIDGAQL